MIPNDFICLGDPHGHIPDKDGATVEDSRGATKADGAVQSHAPL